MHRAHSEKHETLCYRCVMNFSEVNQYSGQVIQAYDEGQITVSGRVFTNNLIVMADRTVERWTEQSAECLDQTAIDVLAALEVQVVILGTGNRQIFPHPSLLATLTEKGIGVEVMTTAAACRTYNILLSEERPVAAALLLDT